MGEKPQKLDFYADSLVLLARNMFCKKGRRILS